MLALVLAGLLWGTSDVAGKLALDAVPPVTLAALRFCVALAILWPLARRRGCGRVPARTAAPLGLLGVSFSFLLQNLGLERTSASNASLLQSAAPALTLALAAAVLGERPTRFGLGGAGTAMAGVATVTLSSGGGLRVPGTGDALVLASAGCFAAFAVLGRRAFPAHGILPVLVGMAAWGMAGLAPAAVVELLVTRPDLVGLREAALVLYLGVGCSTLTYALWGFALRYTEAGRAAVFDSLVPIVGVAAAVLVLGEHPTMWQVTGGVLVVVGLWLAAQEDAPEGTRDAVGGRGYSDSAMGIGERWSIG